MRFGGWKIALGLVAVVGVAWAFSQRSTYASASADPEVLATVGGVSLTRDDVEATNPEQFSQLRQQLFDLTEQSLEQTIQIKLFELEAESRGVTTEELLFDEV